LYYTASGIVTFCRWPSGAQVERCCIIQFDLPMMSTTMLETCRGI